MKYDITSGSVRENIEMIYNRNDVILLDVCGCQYPGFSARLKREDKIVRGLFSCHLSINSKVRIGFVLYLCLFGRFLFL